MKKVLVFAVDTATNEEFCAIFKEEDTAILGVHATIDDWARYIYADYKHVQVKYTLVVDYIRIGYRF